ncbi:MAG: hypothetical protein IJZ06_07450 [Bacteroidales bacterium]|nr:hypothetical protein [Bacteroidales bacterium]
MNKLAQFISTIFHPVLLPTWMFLVIIASDLYKILFINVGLCFAIVFVTTFVFPIISMLILKKFKVIKSLTMEKREERFIPLFIMVVFLYATTRFFKGISMLSLYNFYLICNMLLCVVVFWVNLFWKISFHGIGWGAFSATLLIMTTISADVYLPFFITSLFISGIVGSARLYLKSHNESQIYVGFIVGFIMPLLIYAL